MCRAETIRYSFVLSSQMLYCKSFTIVLFTFYAVCKALTNETEKQYIVALYFSQWSYPNHLPADIPLSRITNLYFAFANIDPQIYSINFGDGNFLKNKIDFPLQVLISDTQDLEYQNISENTNSECYNLIEWVNDYYSNFQKLSITNSQFSQGLLGQLQQLKKLNPRLRVSLSIGGSNTFKSFRAVTAYKENMKKFVLNVVTYVERLGFDGVDIDWEFPKTSNDSKMLARLIKNLYLEFTRRNSEKLITLAIPLDTDVLKHFDFYAMDQYINYYNLMGYDITGKWSPRSGFQSQLYTDPNIIGYTISVDNSLKYLSKYINKKKVVLGMPAYGTTFDTNRMYDKFENCAKIDLENIQQDEDTDYYEECNIDYHFLPPPGYLEVSNTEIGAAYAYSDNSVENAGLIVYDTPEIARLKARYVIDNGLAGGFWWDSKGDTLIANTSRSLVYNFIDELGGIYVLSRDYPLSFNGGFDQNMIQSNGDMRYESRTSSTCRRYILLYLFLFHCLIIFI